MPFLALLLLALGTSTGADAREPPRAVSVFPSGPEVPENLLRLTVTLAAPASAPVLPLLALRRVEGEPIDEPFLEQELWSSDGRTLTILMHPGRVKTGLDAHERLGRALKGGQDVVLTLAGREVHRWRVVAADVQPPAPERWHLTLPAPGTRAPLVVRLDGPVEGQAVNLLAVSDAAGERVTGHARLDEGEGTWRFTPERPWRAGPHALRIHPLLEDAAGNRVGRRFEQAAAPGETAVPGEDVTSSPRIDFTVSARPAVP